MRFERKFDGYLMRAEGMCEGKRLLTKEVGN
jgi:hypothetical protein